MSLALAAGWERAGFYQMADSGTCQESSIWGLSRDDGSVRPAFTSYKTIVDVLRGASNIQFAPYVREEQAWGTPWPDNPDSYYPNWRIYQVVADRADQRVSVLWNADGSPIRARIPKIGSAAVRLDKMGNPQPVQEVDGWYVFDLAPARVRGPFDPPGYFYIGGDPVIIVQMGIAAGAPVAAPGLGDPGSVAKEFKAFISPENGQKIGRGQSAQFSLRVQGFEGFADPVNVRLKEYSTQRDPAPQRGLPGTLSLSAPGTVNPGQTMDVQVQTSGGVASGIHFLTLELEGGGIVRTVDLVVQID
jgi:hypothetical protein